VSFRQRPAGLLALIRRLARSIALAQRTPVPVAAEAAAVTDVDLGAHAAATTDAHGGIVAATDARLSNARVPLAHGHVIADTTGLQAGLDGKASQVALGAHETLTTDAHGGIVAAMAHGTTLGVATLDGAGDVQVVVSTTWGIDLDGDPYFDAGGAAVGQESALIIMDDGSFAVTEIGG
jgi:hypothetical protein